MIHILFLAFLEVASFDVGVLEREMAGPGNLYIKEDTIYLEDRFNRTLVVIHGDDVAYRDMNFNYGSFSCDEGWILEGDTLFLPLGEDRCGNLYTYVVLPSYEDYRRYVLIERRQDTLYVELPEDSYEYGFVGKHTVVDFEGCTFYHYFTDENGRGHLWRYSYQY